MHKLPIPIILFCILSPCTASENVRFELLDQEQGLSQTVVTHIVQDTSGFLWFGTQFGLNRYDGNRFKIYSPDPEDPHSLADESVQALLAHSNGDLWIGTQKGLNRINHETGKLELFQHYHADSSTLMANSVFALFEDSEGVLWVGGNNGVCYFVPETQSFRRVPLTPGYFQPAVRSIGQDREGKLWFGMFHQGVFVYDGENMRQLRWDIPDEEKLSNNQINTIQTTADGSVWLGSGNGLDRWLQGTVTSYRNDPDDRNSLPSNMVSSLLEDAEGRLWVGTSGGGVSVYLPELDGFETYDGRNGLPSNLIMSLFQDRSGVYWVGLYGMALCKYAPGKQTFTTRFSPGVWAILQDSAGDIWAGTVEAGLSQMKPDGTVNRYVHDPQNPQSLIGDNVMSLAQPSNPQKIWVGTQNGLDLFDKKSQTFTHVNHPSSQYARQFIRSLYVDSDDHLWIGSLAGLTLYDPVSGDSRDWRHNPEDPTNMVGNRVYFIRQDASGAYWMGTDQGLNRFQKPVEEIRKWLPGPNSLSNENVVSFLESSDGHLWFGSYNGLNLMNPDGASFSWYTKKDGLADNAVLGVLEDDRGNLWLSTIRGVSQMKRFGDDNAPLSTPIFRNYFKKDGLPNDEFNVGGYHKGPDGSMYFGGVVGIVSFVPGHQKPNLFPPEVALTDFQLFNRSKDLPRPIHLTKGLTLDHRQDNLAFEFAALHYAAPSKNSYAFQLDGFDPNWYYTDASLRRATYTNLAPGNYTFRVKAANGDGIWNEEGVGVQLHILPAPWQTWWAIVIYALTGLAAIMAVVRFAAFREKEKARLSETELRARAAEAQAQAMEAENRRKTAELEEARSLQLSMLPHENPDCPFLDIAAGMRTATEVGGDYYDFQLLESDQLLLAVGDATGHGLKAGTMVSVIKTLFKSRDPDQAFHDFFKEATQTIKQMNMGNIYMALTLARMERNRLVISAAGMPPMLHYEAQTRKVKPIVVKGLPLGGVSRFPYQEVEIAWKPGDTVVFLSDGLEERFNPDNEMLGLDRIVDALEKVGSQRPGAILETLRETGDHWAKGRPLDDDETLVILRHKG